MRRHLSLTSSVLLGIALTLASTAIALADGGGGSYPR